MANTYTFENCVSTALSLKGHQVLNNRFLDGSKCWSFSKQIKLKDSVNQIAIIHSM